MLIEHRPPAVRRIRSEMNYDALHHPRDDGHLVGHSDTRERTVRELLSVTESHCCSRCKHGSSYCITYVALNHTQNGIGR